jgi:hypothetical protein
MNGMSAEQFKDGFCHHYLGQVISVVSGERLVVELDLGFDITHSCWIKLVGYTTDSGILVNGDSQLFLEELVDEMAEIHGTAKIAVKMVDDEEAHVWVLNPQGTFIDLFKLMQAAGYGTYESPV